MCSFSAGFNMFRPTIIQWWSLISTLLLQDPSNTTFINGRFWSCWLVWREIYCRNSRRRELPMRRNDSKLCRVYSATISLSTFCCVVLGLVEGGSVKQSGREVLEFLEVKQRIKRFLWSEEVTGIQLLSLLDVTSIEQHSRVKSKWWRMRYMGTRIVYEVSTHGFNINRR